MTGYSGKKRGLKTRAISTRPRRVAGPRNKKEKRTEKERKIQKEGGEKLKRSTKAAHIAPNKKKKKSEKKKRTEFVSGGEDKKRRSRTATARVRLERG